MKITKAQGRSAIRVLKEEGYLNDITSVALALFDMGWCDPNSFSRGAAKYDAEYETALCLIAAIAGEKP